MSGSDVHLLDGPSDFISSLLSGIRSARSRIVLASLYLGSGEAERELIAELENALKANPDLKVNILIDYLRGTRQPDSSVSLLFPLIAKYPQLHLYHTPDLNGLKKVMLPSRFNESIGLFHMKAYIFDNDLILSGANLSETYFTNRQDRYVRFSQNGPLASNFNALIATISNFSYKCFPVDGMAQYSPPSVGLDPVQHSFQFKERFRFELMHFMKSWSLKYPCPSYAFDLKNWPKALEKYDTSIIPLFQAGPLNIRQDENAVVRILNNATDDRAFATHITSGYFNFSSRYEDIILKSKQPVNILTACPKANGFYGAKGISGFIPDAYSIVQDEFLNKLERQSIPDKKVCVYEYDRIGWTYHAKGMWLYDRNDGDKYPFLTLLGSSNFGQRSVERDIEAQVLVLTKSRDLKERLHENLETLYQHARIASASSAQYGMWLKAATRLIRTML